MRERLAEVRRQVAGMAVRAPVSGEVYGMRVFAPREVIRPGEADPPYRARKRRVDRAGAARPDPCRPGPCRPGGGAAVLGLSGAQHAGVRGSHSAGVGGHRARRADRLVLVRVGTGNGPGGGAGRRPAGRSLGLICVRAGRRLALDRPPRARMAHRRATARLQARNQRILWHRHLPATRGTWRWRRACLSRCTFVPGSAPRSAISSSR